MKTEPKARVKGISISQSCECFNLTRDSFYKYRKRAVRRKALEVKVVNMVKEQRKYQPRVGTRKLYRLLENDFVNNNIKVGRDRLFDILRKHNILIGRKKSSYRTPNSYHRFYKSKNLIKDMKILTHSGSISKKEMEKQVLEIYKNFDIRKKEFEALQAKIDLYQKFKDYYSYGFYIARKNE